MLCLTVVATFPDERFPKEPDPMAMMSKRRWERSVQDWRRELRSLANRLFSQVPAHAIALRCSRSGSKIQIGRCRCVMLTSHLSFYALDCQVSGLRSFDYRGTQRCGLQVVSSCGGLSVAVYRGSSHMDDVCQASHTQTHAHTHTHCERPFLVAQQSQALARLRHSRVIERTQILHISPLRHRKYTVITYFAASS